MPEFSFAVSQHITRTRCRQLRLARDGHLAEATRRCPVGPPPSFLLRAVPVEPPARQPLPTSRILPAFEWVYRRGRCVFGHGSGPDLDACRFHPRSGVHTFRLLCFDDVFGLVPDSRTHYGLDVAGTDSSPFDGTSTTIALGSNPIGTSSAQEYWT